MLESLQIVQQKKLYSTESVVFLLYSTESVVKVYSVYYSTYHFSHFFWEKTRLPISGW